MKLRRRTQEKPQPPNLKPHSFLNSSRFVTELLFIVIGAAIIIANQLYLANEYLFIGPLLNAAGGMIAVVFPTIILYNRYRTRKEMEQEFIVFVEDLTDSLHSGMTLPVALDYTTKRDYGALNRLLQEMAVQVDWGIPFARALLSFSKKTPSSTIRRAVDTIVETYKAGGRLTTTMKSISESLVMIDRIRKERSASVHSQVLTSYMIFFVFIFILIVLQSFLIPVLSSTELPVIGSTGVELSPRIPDEIFTQSFTAFIVIQGLFAGLVTGKLSEGALSAGFKHSILLIAFGYTVFSVFSQIRFVF